MRACRGSVARQPVAAAVAVVAMLVGGCGAPPAATGASGPGTAAAPDPEVVARAVRGADLAADLDAIAAIAAEHGGTRGTGSPGDLATAAYVEDALAALGYAPLVDAFATPVFTDPGGSEVAITGRASYAGSDRVLPLVFSPAGEAEGPIANLGWDPEARAADGPGCEAADFAGLPRGAIVLVRPAPCFRRQVLVHAQAAGAGALVTAAPWFGPGEVRRSTLVTPDGLTIPAVAVSRDVAEVLAQGAAAGRRARVTTTGTTSEGEVRTVIAERAGSDPSRVVMLGAHLDSALDGPGLNDDGSGVAAVMAAARAFADTTPAATVRFAFWAAEETGLHGSTRYVEGLPPEERNRLVAYLNADMLGSPNGFAGVYDEPGAAEGSGAIRDALGAALDDAGIAWEPVDLGLGADHAPFAAAGIPTGGVFSGASEPLTPEQAARSASEAGQPADACYHLACDGRTNVDQGRLLVLARALVQVAAELAAGTP